MPAVPPRPSSTAEPVDPDVDLSVPAQRASGLRDLLPVLLAVAAGGPIGAAARYGVSLAWPTVPGGFPWATLWINVAGCALLGVLLVLISELWTAHPLVRPFLGTGVLGGFTTFSTYVGDAAGLVQAGRADLALAYVLGTVFAALVAVWVAATATRLLAGGFLGRRSRVRT